MKKRLAKWLSALLVAALLLTNVALMEEAPVEAPVDDEVIVAEPAAETAEAEPEVEAPEAEEEAPAEEASENASIEAVDVAVDEIDAADLTGIELDPLDEVLIESDTAALGVDVIPIDQDHFSDPVFRKYVSDHWGHDGNLDYDYINSHFTGEDLWQLTLATGYEVENPTGIGVTSLDGLKYLSFVINVDCSYNDIGTLDISGLDNLVGLSCYHSNLTSLTLNSKVLGVLCFGNALTTLDLSNSPEINNLSCYGNAGLTSLDISKCPKLVKAVTEGTKTTEVYDGQNVVVYTYEDDANEIYHYIECDPNLKIITSAAPAATAAPAPAPVVGVVIVPIPATRASTKSTVYVGTPYQVDAANAAAKGYKSSNKKIATVDANGIVTPRKAGKVKITFKVGKKKRTVKLTVKDPTIPTAIALNLAGTVPAQVGVPQALAVTLPEGTYSGIKWKSSNKKVATVSNGVVTFKKAGKVTITATAARGKKKAKVKFKVTK